jgi:hypothetical protein
MSYQKHKSEIWLKAKRIPGKNPESIRKDAKGNIIRWLDYGKPTLFGWHIDHHIPQSKGGSDELCNLVPMQYAANIRKSNTVDRTNRTALVKALAKKPNAYKEGSKCGYTYSKKLALCPGDLYLVKQTPVTDPQHAYIVRVKRTGVVVKWLISGFEEEIEPDTKLFLQLGKRISI